ncbi:MAG: LamG domain-containing protein [Bacteroidetes bacterium]|nr:LamG domain-containing protein [Bacteroidota bacterium]
MRDRFPIQVSIHTPVELDLAARELQRQINRSGSPLYRFTIIIDFLRRIDHLPDLWTSSYLRALYPTLSSCIRHEYVVWTDPQDWKTTVNTLPLLSGQKWLRLDAHFKATWDMAWEKCTLTFAAMNAFRPLHALLLEHQLLDFDLTGNEWTALLNASTVGLDPLDEYSGILQHHNVSLPFLQRARERWDHEREDGRLPGVILLGDQQYMDKNAGVMLHVDVTAQQGTSTRVHFRNTIDENNTETVQQLVAAATAAHALVDAYFPGSPSKMEWMIGFHEHEASYAGESMGLATALSMMYLLQKDYNRARCWRLRPHLVCTGGIESDGTVKDMPHSVLKSKVDIAFFSPAEVLVLPAVHAEEARRLVLLKQRRYPARQFEVCGVASLEDCIVAPGIMRTQYRPPHLRTWKFLKRHKVPLLALLVLIVTFFGAYFWWKAQITYPDLEYTLRIPVEANALVFNPHRADEWQFRDYESVIRPHLPFGDLEIGADKTRNVYLWNITPQPLDVKLAIEGPQADQWFISWQGGRQRIDATSSLRVMIKYVPLSAEKMNEAFFTVRAPSDGRLLTRLRLTGAAGRPTPAGYGLSFDGIDDMLYFGRHAIAFARDEGTIEFWVRVDGEEATLLSNDLNSPQAPAMANMILSYSDGKFNLSVGNNRAIIPIGDRAFAQSGQWHHIALSFTRTGRRIRFLLDGEVLLDRQEEFIIEGVATPYVTIGAYNNSEKTDAHLLGAIDELRVWDRALSPDSIRARMDTPVDGLTPGLLGYWDFDVISEVNAYNANERTQNGILRGRPMHIRSGVPFRINEDDIRLIPGPLNNTAIELQPSRWLQCGSDVLDGALERSYAIRFLHEENNPGVIFTVINQDAWITLADGAVSTAGSEPFVLPLLPGWNNFIARINASQIMEIHLNGDYITTIESKGLRRGPGYRYEGLQVGIHQDKYNSFGPKYYDSKVPAIRARRAVSDFRVWNRRISDADIAAYSAGKDTPDGLVAHWPLDSLPDVNRNFRDRISGHLLHLWRYRGWE